MPLRQFSLQYHSVWRMVLAETLGMFILMSFGIGSVAQAVLGRGGDGGPDSIRWSWGLAVALGVSSSMGASGGHLNPSVTVAMAVLGRFPWMRVPVYMLAQYCGSFLAAATVFIIYKDGIDHYDGGTRQVEGVNATAGIFATYPKPFVSTLTCFGDQIFGTAILLVCVMALTDPNHMGSSSPILSSLTPFLIGALVVVIGMTFGFNCGYAINPARDLSPRIFTALAGWGIEPFSHRNYNYFWVPIVGPHIGAVLGAYLYQLMVGFHWPAQDPMPDSDILPKTVCDTAGKLNEGARDLEDADDLELKDVKSVKSEEQDDSLSTIQDATELQQLKRDSEEKKLTTSDTLDKGYSL